MKHTYSNNFCILKGTLSFLKIFSRQFVLLLSVLTLALSVPTADTFAQTDKKGNFFQRRFKRKNKFQRKSSRNKDDFQRKPYDCTKIGKTKVEKLRISKKQLRKWEEERLVKEQQAKLKAKREQNSTLTLSASTDSQDLSELATSQTTIEQTKQITNKTKEKKKNTAVSPVNTATTSSDAANQTIVATENTDKQMLGWYETDKPQAPSVAPIRLTTTGEIEKEHLESFETAAKYGRLGYLIYLKSANKQALATLEAKFIQTGVAKTYIKTTVDPLQEHTVHVAIEAR